MASFLGLGDQLRGGRPLVMMSNEGRQDSRAIQHSLFKRYPAIGRQPLSPRLRLCCGRAIVAVVKFFFSNFGAPTLSEAYTAFFWFEVAYAQR